MTDKIAIIGQSNASNLWAISGISTFSTELNSRTGKSVSIIQGAVGGSSLLKEAAQSGFPNLHWGDKYNASSPLYAFLQNDLGSLRAVWWIGDEQGASAGMDVNPTLCGLVRLHADIASAAGKEPKELPLVVSPIGNAARIYTNGWKVRKAQELVLAYPGFVAGPEYIDLAVESDTIHLTSASRETFAVRGATALAPLVGSQPIASGSVAAKVKTFTRDVSIASGSQSITGFGFQPKVVRFTACLNTSQYASWDGKDDGLTAN